MNPTPFPQPFPQTPPPFPAPTPPPPSLIARTFAFIARAARGMDARLSALTPGRRALMFVAAGLIGVCVLCCAATTMGAVVGNVSGLSVATQPASSAPRATPVPKPTATPKATPVPTATVDRVAAYKAVVIANATKVSDSANGVHDACSAGDLIACRAALVTFDDAIHAFQADLDRTPAPACYKPADTSLRAGLKLYDKGATEAIDGIDQTDASLITQGTADINAGTPYIDAATAKLQAAHC